MQNSRWLSGSRLFLIVGVALVVAAVVVFPYRIQLYSRQDYQDFSLILAPAVMILLSTGWYVKSKEKTVFLANRTAKALTLLMLVAVPVSYSVALALALNLF